MPQCTKELRRPRLARFRAARGLQRSRRAGPGDRRGRPSLGRAEEVARETRRAERAAAAASPAPPPRPGLLGRHAAPSAPQPPPLGAAEPDRGPELGAAARGQEVPPPAPPPARATSSAPRAVPGRSRWWVQGRRRRLPGPRRLRRLLRLRLLLRRLLLLLRVACHQDSQILKSTVVTSESIRERITDDAIYYWLFHSTSIFIEHLPETKLGKHRDHKTLCRVQRDAGYRISNLGRLKFRSSVPAWQTRRGNFPPCTSVRISD
ncbi:uncharacterized protein LOC143269153 [Peromyscus maniculatus bairdii]|uniref:uncharacterized protein LOC143269153 n=1 Tax=Peromyscus maniculatus bairdii TaxID=230844 RepID=UPI003FCF37DC